MTLTSHKYRFVLLLPGLLLAACGEGNGGGSAGAGSSGNGTGGGVGSGVQDATSALCPNVTGAEAIGWDFASGVIRTDVGVLPPPVPPFTGANSFLHPSFPVLSFIYPEGWVPETIDGPDGIGVNLIRSDSRAIYRWLQRTVSGVPAARDVRDVELQQLLEFIGLAGAQVQTVCVNEGTQAVGGGIISEFSTILIRAGDHTALISTNVFPFPGLATASANRVVVCAPTVEFPDRVIDTFLAIEFQRLFTDGAQEIPQCSDGMDNDGDLQIDFPNDPQCSGREDRNEGVL